MSPWVKPQERSAEIAVRFAYWAAGLLGLAAAGAVFAFIAREAWPAFEGQGLYLLVGREWSVSDGRFGALPMLAGSLAVTLAALAMSLPLGLSAAVVTSECVPSGLRPFPKLLMEILAAIPSVVYGLIGIAVLVPWLQDTLGLLTGRTLLTGGVVLGVMVLPTFATVAEDALKAVSRKKREAGWALGLTRTETILYCVLPEAKAGIAAAALLALGRAFGETIAVMLLVGSLDRLPSSWYDWLLPGQTLTSKIGREAAESAVGSAQYHALAALGAILLVSVVTITFIGSRLIAAGREQRT